MDKGKRAEDSEVVVVVRSHRLKVKIKELFNLERNGASTRERKVVGMRRARDILQSPSGPDRGESHEIRTQRICYRYTLNGTLAVAVELVEVVPCALVSVTTLLSSGPTPCEGAVQIRIGSTAEVKGTAFCVWTVSSSSGSLSKVTHLCSGSGSGHSVQLYAFSIPPLTFK